MNIFIAFVAGLFLFYSLCVGPLIALENTVFRDFLLPELSLLQTIIIIFLCGPVVWVTAILGLIIFQISNIFYYLYRKFLQDKVSQFWNWAGTIGSK